MFFPKHFPLSGPAEAEPGSRAPHLVLLGLALATVLAVLVGAGNLAIAVAPCLLALLLGALWREPPASQAGIQN